MPAPAAPTILAEVTGFAMTSDASDIVTPNLSGAVRAMRGALRDAGLAPEAIGYINAHGTGTTVNDKTECAAVRAVFGAARRPADDLLDQVDARPPDRRHRRGRAPRLPDGAARRA